MGTMELSDKAKSPEMMKGHQNGGTSKMTAVGGSPELHGAMCKHDSPVAANPGKLPAKQRSRVRRTTSNRDVFSTLLHMFFCVLCCLDCLVSISILAFIVVAEAFDVCF